MNLPLILLSGLLIASGSLPCGTWWVFFSDRGPDLDRRLETRSTELLHTPSYERRISVGLFTADELDLEPWSGYVEQVADAAVCLTVRTRSRFLNAVSVSTADVRLEEILALPFVDHVRPVSSSTFRMPEFRAYTGYSAGVTALQLAQIELDELHSRGWKGEGVVVGVLDSGFNLTHDVFRDIRVLEMYDFVDDDSDPSQQPRDPPGQSDHGTAVLSILGGYAEDAFCGGVPDASFILAKTEDISDEYQAEEDYWVQGLEWIELNGGDIVSSSLAYIDWYTYSDLDGNTAVTTIAADAAASRGMVVFNSIGNSGPDPGSLLAPSDGDSVFAVGAVDAGANVAQFSSRGPTYDGRIKPDACALGEDVSLAYQGTSGYSRGNGTSFAAPLVSSVAGALLGAHPEWDMIEIMEILRSTSSQSCTPGNSAGYGIINAYAALKYHSVTGSVRSSLTGDYIPEYPLTLTMGDSIYVMETNRSGWFAFCPGKLGEFIVSDGGGDGSVIPVTGTLRAEGVEIEMFVDQTSCTAAPSVYPNPSTEGIYIGFDLAAGPVDTELTVFDLTGQIIYESVRRGIGPGSFRAPLPEKAFYWDGTCNDGSPASSGIYIVSLRTGGMVHLMKCSMVR
ncbi:MAG: S8 family serine peptidase [Candidatus Aegiribacteria sp.]|nr:S8 family serine peptidase [Candidatus Aegiribacteria sp.]